ncbi:uncharacterized protein [Typha latifolia]|uniref:uncharacterized protein n=1 Tax=Typha latifolia TaxID=4733 RepID=UPI003C2C0FC3
MGSHRISVDSSMSQKNGGDNEKAYAKCEPSEEEEPSKEEFVEEDPDEEEEPNEVEANDELESNGEELSKDACEEEPVSDEVVASKELKVEKEPGEEEPSERCEAQSSSDSDHDEKCKSSSAKSSLERKRRSIDKLDNHLEKRKKMDESPKLDLYAGTPDTDYGSKLRRSTGDGNVLKKEENTGSSGKRRRNRWDTEQAIDDEEAEISTKKRKTRWSIDDAQLKMLGPLKLPEFSNNTVLESILGQEIQKLSTELQEINQNLKNPVFLVDDQHDYVTSRSPVINNKLDVMVNGRSARLRAELIKRRQNIISQLIRMNPTFHPPSDYKPAKLYKKLYIPEKEFPGYNFIGLIIGPRGNTQKRMEKESGARILLRGKGSNRQGRGHYYKDRISEKDNEDLHVYIEADTQQSLDAAVKMVEKLLVPVKEGTSELKRAQLRELAELKGTLKENNSSEVRKKISRAGELCDICGNVSHLTAYCPLTASTPGTGTSTHEVNFLREVMQCGPSPFSSSPTSISVLPRQENHSRHALSGYDAKSLKGIDEAKLFVGYLPHSVNTDKLIELFQPFGPISEAVVIIDKTTGLSKGYGFVRYANPIFASEAAAWMNGYRIEGKMLAVRIAGCPPSTDKSNFRPEGSPSVISLPTYPGPAAFAQGQPALPDWPGPPGSMLPVNFNDFPKSNGFLSYYDPVNREHLPSFGALGYNMVSPSRSGTITSSRELQQFPGYLRSSGTQDNVHHFAYSSASPQIHLAQYSRVNRTLFTHLTPPP